MRVVAFLPGVILIAITAIVVFLTWHSTSGPFAPGIAAAAAVIAVTSVSVTALTSYANWVRGKRQATLTAWSDWMKESEEDRAAISDVIGVNAGLNEEQGKAICDGLGFTAKGTKINERSSRELRARVRRVLARLERLAVGIEQMVYDQDLLMQIGGTIVVTTYARYKTYIVYTQLHPDENKRRPLAYRALDALVTEVESEEGQARRQLFDEARLRRIRQTTGEQVG